MTTVFIVMADAWEYCTNQWVIGVFTDREKAEAHCAQAQARADAVHAKIRALGEEDGIPATWRDVCITEEWKRAHAHLKRKDGEWFKALKQLKRETFPEDPNAYLGWDGTMHYTVQEWSVDEHRHSDFPKICF